MNNLINAVKEHTCSCCKMPFLICSCNDYDLEYLDTSACQLAEEYPYEVDHETI